MEPMGRDVFECCHVFKWSARLEQGSGLKNVEGFQQGPYGG